MSRIDDAVRNILTLKYQLGLFDDPMRGADAPTVIGSSASRQVNLEAARESITLLKNEDHACLFRRPRTFSSLGRLLPSDDFYGRGEEVSRARLVIKAPHQSKKEVDIGLTAELVCCVAAKVVMGK